LLTSLNVAERQQVLPATVPDLQLVDVEVAGGVTTAWNVPVVGPPDVEMASVLARLVGDGVGWGLSQEFVVHEEPEAVIGMPGHLHVVPAVRFEPRRRHKTWSG